MTTAFISFGPSCVIADLLRYSNLYVHKTLPFDDMNTTNIDDVIDLIEHNLDYVFKKEIVHFKED
jgi:hypothetical protein